MLKRVFGYLSLRDDPVPDATRCLQDHGYAIVRDVFEAETLAALTSEIVAVFDALPPDIRTDRPPGYYEDFRYEMLNRSPLCQRAISSPTILSIIEPLLGDDSHIIANTAWRNPPGATAHKAGQPWHIDAGPHIPRPPETRWPDEIPYPIFAIAVHILLQDQTLADGPTGVIPGSHRSGQFPPFEHMMDADLECDGERCTPVLGRAGDVTMFVSDLWHRRMPTSDAGAGRFFLQIHYGRRDLAQRIRTTSLVNALSPEAIERAGTAREQTVIGLHPPHFYDA